ncbi:hypothetical protein P5V15_007126 [Pogonomyrmex californicus]
MLTLSILLIVEFIPRKISPGYVTTSCSLSRVPLSSTLSHGLQPDNAFPWRASPSQVFSMSLDEIATSAGERLAIFSSITNLLLHLGKRSHPESSPRAVEEGTPNEIYACVDKPQPAARTSFQETQPLYPIVEIEMEYPREIKQRRAIFNNVGDSTERNACATCKEIH